jgi:hypothetical protein
MLGPKHDVSADKKVSASDDTGDGGLSLAEPIAPNQISFDASKQSDPFAIVQVPIDVPPTGG